MGRGWPIGICMTVSIFLHGEGKLRMRTGYGRERALLVLCPHRGVVAFAFAEHAEFATEEIGSSESGGRIGGDLFIIDVEAAAFEEAVRIAFGGSEGELDKQIGHAGDGGEIDGATRRGGGGFYERIHVGSGKIGTPKEGFGGEHDFLQFGFTMHKLGDFGGETFVAAAEFGAGSVFGFDGGDFVL